MKRFFYTLVLGFIAVSGQAQYISITSQSAIYSQDFNTLGTSGTALTTLPSGWWIWETPGNAGYRAGDGTANNGDTYSFGTGTATDRSLGGLASGSAIPHFGVRYINNSGSSFSSFYFDLVMEQWRSGGRTGLDSLYFYYTVNNSTDSMGNPRTYTGTWTRATVGDLVSKVTLATGQALDGNLPANRQYYGFQITGVTVNVGDTLYLRWTDPNVAGSDDGLSIDDYRFSVTSVLPVKYKSFNATRSNNVSNITWSTASETNNSHFEVQRSADNKSFETIGRVKGSGNSVKVVNYNFTDKDAATSKTTYYRLKQVDFDGKSEYSKTVSVVNTATKAGIGSTLPNPFNTDLSITVTSNTVASASVVIMDMIGKVHHTSTETLQSGSNTINVNTTDMPDGIYFVRVSFNGETYTQKVVKK